MGLELDDIAEVLGETLGEEKDADDALGKLAVGGVFKTGINDRAPHI